MWALGGAESAQVCLYAWTDEGAVSCITERGVRPSGSDTFSVESLSSVDEATLPPLACPQLRALRPHGSCRLVVVVAQGARADGSACALSRCPFLMIASRDKATCRLV